MPTNKQHLSSKDIIINITGNNYFYKSFFSVTTIYKNIKMDQTKNLKENSSLIQANEVIRCLHQLLRDSNDKKVSSESIHLESFLISIGEELNDKDIKEDR